MSAKCGSCGAEITWGKTANNKACPMNPDGTSHFTTCPNAASHSKGRSVGDRLDKLEKEWAELAKREKDLEARFDSMKKWLRENVQGARG